MGLLAVCVFVKLYLTSAQLRSPSRFSVQLRSTHYIISHMEVDQCAAAKHYIPHESRSELYMSYLSLTTGKPGKFS